MAPVNANRLPEHLDLRLRLCRALSGSSLESWTEKEFSYLRAHIKTDSRVVPLIFQVLELTEGYQFYDVEATMLEMIIDELPDSFAANYLLRRLSFEKFTGEKGAVGEIAHRLMERRFPEHPRLLTSIVRTAGIRNFSYKEWSYPDDSSAREMDHASLRRLTHLALREPVYIPLLASCAAYSAGVEWPILITLALSEHFSPDDYSLPESSEKIISLREAAINARDVKSKIKLMAIFIGEGVAFDAAFADPLNPHDIELLKKIAASESHALALRAARRLAHDGKNHPDLLDWLYLKVKGPSSWEFLWALMDCDDPEWVLRAVEARMSDTATGHEWLLLHGIRRLCSPPWKLPCEKGTALIDRAIRLHGREKQDWKLWKILVEAYPAAAREHSDLSALIRASKGESHEVTDLIVAMAGNDVFRDDVITLLEGWISEAIGKEKAGEQSPIRRWCAALAACRTPGGLDLLIKVVREDGGKSEKRSAIDAIGQGWPHDPKRKSLLFELLADPDIHTRHLALKLLLRDFHSDPESVERMRQMPHAPEYAELHLLVREWLDDRTLEKWRSESEGRRVALMGKMEMSSGYHMWRNLHSLVYWHGENEETIRYLIARVVAPTDPLEHPSFPEVGGYPRRLWSDEASDRCECLRIMVLAYPEDLRVKGLLKESMEHPWQRIREEAARLLARAYQLDPETPRLIEAHLCESIWIFYEYVALMTGRPEGMTIALDALARLEESDSNKHFALSAPHFLVRYFGPLKSLGEEFVNLTARSTNSHLHEGIANVLNKFYV